MLLCLLSLNVGVLWVALEGATLSTVLLVSLYRTPASLEAAWKYFILCSVGIAQALFGTILLYFAAEKVLGPGGDALLWTHLHEVRGELEPTVLSLSFVFLLVGYGTKVGLVPLHNWLPDAHAEGPTPISAVLSGLLLNVALYAVVRSKVLVDGALGRNFSGGLMMGFGLLSVVVAAFFLSKQRDIKRMFAYSSVEHMGIMTFAFGMGGPVAAFAGLLHMTVHSLTKSAIFFTVGHASQTTGTQNMDSIRGLIQQSPTIGWGLALGSLAILGMPPFGVFTSEFMVLTTAMHEHSWATPLLLVALGVAFAAIFGKVQPMVFGETVARRRLRVAPRACATRWPALAERAARARGSGLLEYYRSLPVRQPDAARCLRPAWHSCPGQRRSPQMAAPWRLARWRVSAAQGLQYREPLCARRRRLSVRQGRGRGRARDSGRPGTRRHHRAGAFPLLDRGREDSAAGGKAWLHTQGDREALRDHDARGGRAPRRARQRGLDSRLRLGVGDGGRGRDRH